MNEAPPSQGLVGGKYQLVRLIGRGGMGSVWEARHVSLGTPSAIKFIEAEFANSQEARSRFDREAKAAATIQSKHAIQIFDHGVTEAGKPYIVMELLQGEPLDKCIDRQRLSLQETANIIQQVSRGLARAHERGIVHRDLKPENIFLVKTPEDDELTAKVLDFGIAKDLNMTGTTGGISSSTKTGAVLGTPFYMAPEQARGLRNVDYRADVWSLGVIAFKCLTGKLPFDGESVGDLLGGICTSPIPVPSQLYPGIPPNFDAWFMRALERDVERRFGSVTELGDALCAAAGIATRSRVGPGYSGTAFAPGAGVNTPQHPHVAPGNAAQGVYPMQHTPSGYGPGSALAGPTPAPAAMTNAPFTSESIPGVSSGRGKIIAAGVFALMLVFGSTAAVIFLMKGKTVAQSDPTNGVVAPLPTSSLIASASAPLPGAEPAPSAATALQPLASAAASSPAPSATVLAIKPAKAAANPPAGRALSNGSKGAPLPPPLPVANAAATPSPVPPAPPQPPPPAAKKTNKNDPGY